MNVSRNERTKGAIPRGNGGETHLRVSWDVPLFIWKRQNNAGCVPGRMEYIFLGWNKRARAYSGETSGQLQRDGLRNYIVRVPTPVVL